MPGTRTWPGWWICVALSQVTNVAFAQAQDPGEIQGVPDDTTAGSSEAPPPAEDIQTLETLEDNTQNTGPDPAASAADEVMVEELTGNVEPTAGSVEPTAADQELASMSLEELLNLPTTVSSKREERTSDASATITAYAARDMEALGYYTLSDLANFTAGYSSTIMYGERVFETRGQKAGSCNNNTHLVYVNGIPVNHARNYKAPADHDLPLYFADRVEFLKGPASALYGTSAFFGVVNIVPKELTTDGAMMESRVSMGTSDQEVQVMSNAMFTNSVGRSTLSVGYYDKAASRDYVGVNDSAQNRFWDDQQSVFVNASHKLTSSALRGLSLGLVYMRKNGGLGEHWNESAFSHQINDLTWETFVPYLKYERNITSRLSYSGYLLWNRGHEKGVASPFSPDSYNTFDGTGSVLFTYDAQVNSVQGQSELRWNVHDHAAYATEVIGGVNIDTRQQDGRPDSYGYNLSADAGEPYQPNAVIANGSDRYNTYSAYLQLRQELPLLSGTIITAGAREDIGVSPTQTYSQISPRAGVVQRLTDHLNMRAFLGAALRGPGLKEVELNRESKNSLELMNLPTSDIKDVKAETIRSVEGGPVWASQHFVASATAFYNITHDALDGRTYEGQNIAVNANGETVAYGGEGEIQIAPNRQVRFIANYAWAKAQVRIPDAKDLQAEDVPVSKLNGAIIYDAPAPVSLRASLVGRWVQAYRSATGPQADGNFTLDANLVKDLPAGFSVWAQVRNILNQKAKLPKHGLEDVPLPGATALFSLSHRLQ
jgi:outer membrane receptor protein involved in Fe transport